MSMRGEGPVPERHARYRWAAEAVDDGRVLDAACGAGDGTAMLAESAVQAVGVDLSPAAIAEAKRRHGERARFVEGDLRALPFADGDFEYAVCFEALAHIAEPEGALDELRRVVRPGGTLLVSTPNPATYPPGHPLHLSSTGPEELERLLRTRFANVAVHRQQTYLASLLVGQDLPARDDAPAEIAVHVTKLAGEGPGSELYAVAAASDGELPREPAWLALGQEVGHGEQQRMLGEWQDRAVRAEAEASALRRKLRDRQS